MSLEWSPKETYIITCEKPKTGAKNLVIWDSKTGQLVAEFEWKNQAIDGPMSIKFDEDEKFCAR